MVMYTSFFYINYIIHKAKKKKKSQLGQGENASIVSRVKKSLYKGGEGEGRGGGPRTLVYLCKKKNKATKKKKKKKKRKIEKKKKKALPHPLTLPPFLFIAVSYFLYIDMTICSFFFLLLLFKRNQKKKKRQKKNTRKKSRLWSRRKSL